jgi:transcriptional regulator with XRE-family HTH domain
MVVRGRPITRTLTSAQCRAVRAWFGWSQHELAARANVSVNSVRNFENESKTVHPNTVAAIRRGIEGAGISLLFDQDGTATGIALEKEQHQRTSGF